jgi:hypothetical protein
MDWDMLPDEATIQKTMEGLKKRNFNPLIVDDIAPALLKLKEMIPPGAAIMEGSSTTLEEIGCLPRHRTASLAKLERSDFRRKRPGETG